MCVCCCAVRESVRLPVCVGGRERGRERYARRRVICTFCVFIYMGTNSECEKHIYVYICPQRVCIMWVVHIERMQIPKSGTINAKNLLHFCLPPATNKNIITKTHRAPQREKHRERESAELEITEAKSDHPRKREQRKRAILF